jgi:hypothetical protein
MFSSLLAFLSGDSTFLCHTIKHFKIIGKNLSIGHENILNSLTNFFWEGGGISNVMIESIYLHVVPYYFDDFSTMHFLDLDLDQRIRIRIRIRTNKFRIRNTGSDRDLNRLRLRIFSL